MNDTASNSQPRQISAMCQVIEIGDWNESKQRVHQKLSVSDFKEADLVAKECIKKYILQLIDEGAVEESPKKPPKVGHPAVAGFAGFGITLMLFQFLNVGWMPTLGPVATAGMLTGGLAQVISGFLEFKTGNNLRFSTFVTYGGFWISYALMSIVSNFKPDLKDIRFFLIVFTMYTCVIVGATCRANLVTFLMFFSLFIGFILLDVGHSNSIPVLKAVAGWFMLFSACCAFYTMAHILYGDAYGMNVLPLGKSPWTIVQHLWNKMDYLNYGKSRETPELDSVAKAYVKECLLELIADGKMQLPKDRIQKKKRGLPVVAGMPAFGLTSMILQFSNIGWLENLGTISAACVLVGGTCQMIAGFLECANGNNYGCCAFVSFGCFKMCFGLAIIFNHLGFPTVNRDDMVFYLIAYTVFNLIITVAAARIHMALFAVFGSQSVGLVLLDLAIFHHNQALQVAGAWFLLFCAFATWYNMAHVLYQDAYKKDVFPLGTSPVQLLQKLPRIIKHKLAGQ